MAGTVLGWLQIELCEIDGAVVDACKRYLAEDITESVFSDPRIEIVCLDAVEYIKGRRGLYDVIIVDSSDPIGPAALLYTSAFYADMKVVTSCSMTVE